MENITTIDDIFGNNTIQGITIGPPTNYSYHEEDKIFYSAILDNSRFIVQRILVPMIMVIGVIGNSITIAILTRRHMQSSTNCYLTALAVSDLFYLVFVFSLSLEHIPGMTHKRHILYWHYYRSALWLTDALSSTSIWLTVVFTVERYIAVCYPMKGKVLCTHSRAKRIIFAVYFACFALTVTTPFEWRIMPDSQVNGHLMLASSSLGSNQTYKKLFYWFSAVTFILIPLTLLAIFNSFLIVAVKHGRKLRRQMTQKKALKDSSSAQQEQKITIMLIAVVVLALFCQMPTAIMLMYSSLKEIIPKSTEDYVMRILGNVFNFLTTLNAASNFILYCVMSDRYRKTFLETVCKRRRDSTTENSVMSGTSYVGMSVQNSFKFISTSSVNKSSNNSKKRPTGLHLLNEAHESQSAQSSFLGEANIRTPITYRTPSPRYEQDRIKRKSNCDSETNVPLIVQVE